MHPLVRRADAGDAPILADFNARLADETEGTRLDLATLTAGVAAALADPTRGRYFVAEIDGEVVGQLMLTTEWSDWRNGWMWWIQSVYIRADARRRGVFRALFAHVEQLAREDPQVVGLRLYVEEENHAAQRTYEQLGMRRTGYLVLEKGPL